jgi:hypothetical protein
MGKIKKKKKVQNIAVHKKVVCISFLLLAFLILRKQFFF